MAERPRLVRMTAVFDRESLDGSLGQLAADLERWLNVKVGMSGVTVSWTRDFEPGTEPEPQPGTTLFVPAADSDLRRWIRAGSGIVGTRMPGSDQVEVYYEGAIYGQADMKTFEDRVYHAWSRCVTRYPTMARAVVRQRELVEVGYLVVPPSYSAARPTVVVERQDLVDAWCSDA